jgi:hypothetical protein
MKKLIVFTFTGLLLFSCSNSTPKTGGDAAQPKQNLLEITNDMENAVAVIPSWINEKTIIIMKEPAAHSGKYACVTNDTIQYSYAYNELVKNINTGLPKKVNIDGWVYTTVANPNLGIILDVSQNKQLYDWKAYPLTDTLSETGKWVEFNAHFFFDKPLNPDQTIKLYAWNQSKNAIYFDDLKISFEY